MDTSTSNREYSLALPSPSVPLTQAVNRGARMTGRAGGVPASAGASDRVLW
jgi:hypothetical protein